MYSKLIQIYIYIYIYIYIPFHILFHYGLLQDIEYSSLCYSRTLLFIDFIYSSLYLKLHTLDVSLAVEGIEGGESPDRCCIISHMLATAPKDTR